MKNPNPNSKKKQKQSSEFDLCKVCNLNHDQSRRHNYLPNHKNSLSSFLSRFLKKLSDLRFFLLNPSLLRPEFASRNRLWCVFCDFEITEDDSLFVCGNAINHLASEEHLKNLKHFLWKYGAGMDRLDSFRVSESELAQWEKKCKKLKSSSPSSLSRKRSHGGTLLGHSKDIHNQLSSDNMDSFIQNSNNSFTFNSNGFLPLQNFTDETRQVYHQGDSRIAIMCTPLHGAISLSACMQDNTNSCGMHAKESITKDLKVYRDYQHILVDDVRESSVGWCPNNGEPCDTLNSVQACQAQPVGNLSYIESRNQVLQSLTQISSVHSNEPKANIHSGAPPPWFEKREENELNTQLSKGFRENDVASSMKKAGKSQKLNPKRVGAAWAEKRKIELEMEKRGEMVRNTFGADWLPNFGRVWQSGTRKESRKEFEIEKQKPVKVDSFSEAPIEIQPYISKRMRKDADGSSGDVNGHFEGITNTL